MKVINWENVFTLVEKYFKEKFPELDVRSAGTHYGYPYQVNEEILEWADIIHVMDLSHDKFIAERYPLHLKKVNVVGISDQYDTDDPYLIEIIDYWVKKNGIRKIQGD